MKINRCRWTIEWDSNEKWLGRNNFVSPSRVIIILSKLAEYITAIVYFKVNTLQYQDAIYVCSELHYFDLYTNPSQLASLLKASSKYNAKFIQVQIDFFRKERELTTRKCIINNVLGLSEVTVIINLRRAVLPPVFCFALYTHRITLQYNICSGTTTWMDGMKRAKIAFALSSKTFFSPFHSFTHSFSQSTSIHFRRRQNKAQ